MIHLTQLLFVKPGAERTFDEFEDAALRLLARHGGELLYRIRPDESAFVAGLDARPYEIHLLAFPSSEALSRYVADEERQRLLPLKEASVESVRSFQGTEL